MHVHFISKGVECCDPDTVTELDIASIGPVGHMSKVASFACLSISVSHVARWQRCDHVSI